MVWVEGGWCGGWGVNDVGGGGGCCCESDGGRKKRVVVCRMIARVCHSPSMNLFLTFTRSLHPLPCPAFFSRVLSPPSSTALFPRVAGKDDDEEDDLLAMMDGLDFDGKS